MDNTTYEVRLSNWTYRMSGWDDILKARVWWGVHGTYREWIDFPGGVSSGDRIGDGGG